MGHARARSSRRGDARATGDERWREAWRESADALWSRRDEGRPLDAAALRRGVRGLGPRTASPATSRRCGRCSTTSAASGSSGRRTRFSRGPRSWRTGSRTGRAPTPELPSPRRRDPAAVVLGRAGDRDRGRRLPRRGAAARGRGARLAGRSARRREGRRHLPRHGRERLRAARGLRPHRRRAVARAGAPLRRARARPGRAKPRPLLALDGRRRRALFVADCLERSAYPVLG